MIPTILNLGMHEPAVEFDLAELNELFSMGIIDAPDDERQPELTTYGLAVFEYLTRL